MGRAEYKLEGGYRLQRILTLKLYTYVMQIIITIGVSVFLLDMMGARLKPFYLPVDSFIYFAILMLLVMGIEAFFFRILEIKYMKSHSKRYLIAKRTIKRAMVIILISSLVVALLWTPFLPGYISEQTQKSGMVIGGQHEFYTKDPLGLTYVREVTVTSNQSGVQVYIISSDNYASFGASKDAALYYGEFTSPGSSVSVEFPKMPHSQYLILLSGENASSALVSYTLKMHMSDTFVLFVPMIAMLFTILNAGVIAYMIPIKTKYQEGSIYR